MNESQKCGYARVRMLSIIIVLSLSVCLSAQAFEGKVVSISDGDTISVMHDGVVEKVRLDSIDCPERGQAFGNKAKEFTGDMVFGKTVNVEIRGRDKYGRTIGEVFLPGGTNLNKELIKAGFAWWYREYSDDKELQQLEQGAKRSQKGLWIDSNPVAPWDWRHNSKVSGKATRNKSIAGQIPSPENQGDTSSPSAVSGTPTGETTPGGSTIYEGPRGGHYHYSKSGNKVYEKKK